MRSLLWVLLAAGLVRADDVSDAADEVQALLRAGKDLGERAARAKPDPWLVADALCARGAFEDADAFARAAPRPDTETLPDYVAWARAHPETPEAREAFAAAVGAEDPREGLALLAIVAARPDGLLAVRVGRRAGVFHARLRSYEEAARVLRANADAAVRLGWLIHGAGSYGMAGDAAMLRSAYETALACHRQRLDIETRRQDRASIAAALQNVGIMLSNLGRSREALEATRRALQLYEELDHPRGIIQTTLNIGVEMHGRGRYQDALRYWERARELLEDQEDEELLNKVLGNLGLVYYRLDRFEESMALLQRALDLARRRGAQRTEANTLNSIGMVHKARAEFDKALDSYERALPLMTDLKDRAGVARVLGNMANIHSTRGDYDKSLEHHERALKLKLAIGNPVNAARTLSNMGSVYGRLGDHRRALRAKHRALEMLEGSAARPVIARTLNDIGTSYHAIGDFDRALEFYTRALEHGAEGELRRQAGTLANIARAHFDLGDFARARELRGSALALYEKAGDHRGVAGVLIDLGMTHAFDRRMDDAERLLRRAADLADGIGASVTAAHARTNLGNLLAARGKVAEALPLLESALAVYEEAGHRRGMVGSLDGLGAALAGMGRHAEARKALLRANAIAETTLIADRYLAAAELGRFHLDHLDQPRESIRWFARAIELSDAARAGARGLGVRHRITHSQQLRRSNALEGMARAQMRLDRPDEALRYLEQGRARAVLDLLARSGTDLLAEARRRADEATARRIDEVEARVVAARSAVIGALNRLAAKRTTAARVDEVAKAKARLKQGLAEEEKVLRERALLVRDVAPVGEPLGTAAIRRLVGQDELLLFYSLGEAGGRLLAVPPSGDAIRAFDLAWPDGQPATSRSVAQAVERFRRRASVRLVRGTAGTRLFRTLVPGELWPTVRTAARVYVVPHGPLHGLPFEGLVVDAKGAAWIDAGPAVAYVPSVSVLGVCRRRAAEAKRGTAVLLGDPDFRGSLPALRGSRREVTAIRAALADAKVEILLGKDATQHRLFELAPAARYLHLATHHVVDRSDALGTARLALARPAESAADSDGFLRLRDLLARWPGRLEGCELVVLAACETQRGESLEDEGVLALPLGFLSAGASAIIASLWRVDDQSTADLFSEFYKRLEQGEGKLAAFTAARRALRKKYPHHYYWAPFVYIGDPR